MSLSISIIGIGRAADGFDTVYDHFLKLIKPYSPISLEFLKPSAPRTLDQASFMLREGEQLRSRWPKNGWPVVLTPEGRRYDTPAFAEWLSRHHGAGRSLVFTIGGAYGLSNEIKKAARESVSLSDLTMAHRVSALVLLEQLYRAFTILSRHPYHK
jgi:23S rRNA (pseudouridine1915-N3)-methyltransferase